LKLKSNPSSLKKNLKVFVGIPNLAEKDQYVAYIKSVLRHIEAQETDVEILKPYITPPHSGKFQHGYRSRLYAIVGRMNNIIEKFMMSGASHVFINDGDVEIPPNTIDTLIKHNVDVASGVYPFHNFVTENLTDPTLPRYYRKPHDAYAMIFGRMSSTNPCGNLKPRDWDYMAGQVFGEESSWSGGTGCLLVKRRVFKQYHPSMPPLRFTKHGKNRECGGDIYFWKRAQDAGFTARVDANIVCGHLPQFPLSRIDEWLFSVKKIDK